MQRMTLLNLGNLQMQMILELVSLVKPSKRWKCLGLHVCKTLSVTSQHSLHTWSMRWTSPIGHADSVKLLWVAPCHLTNLFEARKSMTLYMEVRAAFICHRTCWLVDASCYLSFYTAQSLQCMPVWQGQEPSWFAPTRWFGDQSLHAFPHATPIIQNIQTLWLRARYSGLLAGDFPIFKASKFVHHFQSIFMASWL